MASLIEGYFEIVSGQISSIKADLARADTVGVIPSPARREEAAKVKAATYLFLSASLERFVRSTLEGILLEISSQAIPLAQIRSSLFAIACHSNLTALKDSSRERLWALRTDLFQTLFNTQSNFVSDYELPLDKRTLSLAHFHNIWVVFGFQGQSLPSPLHVTALEELRKGRNDVAHGHIDPVVFGRSKAIPDVLNLTRRVEDIVEHLTLEAIGYLARKGYLRQAAGE